MSLLYVVRCNFSSRDEEEIWNTWYSGKKQDWLLGAPGFQFGQRYASEAVSDGVRYLALYRIDSEAVFKSPYYLASWGFAEWAPYVTDWSRSIFSGAVAETSCATEEGSFLEMVLVELTSAPDVEGDPVRGDATFAWGPGHELQNGRPAILGLRSRPVDDEGGPDVGSRWPEAVHGVFSPISPPRSAREGAP